MILDEKRMMLPPPPYAPATPRCAIPARLSLTGLPSHILLGIIYATFPETDLIDEDRPERQRKTLYWLSTSLRLVNRMFYVVSMHVLRSIYIPAYSSLIRPPYTSDPFPLLAPTSPYTPSSSSAGSPSPLKTIQRETSVLDRFIALKVREDVWADASELHLEREESFKDLFDLLQPRSRLEDLVRIYGIRDGVVTLSPSSPSPPSPLASRAASASTIRLPLPAQTLSPKPSSPSSIFTSLFSKKRVSPPPPASLSTPAAPSRVEITPIPFNLLSVSFSSRQVGLVLLPTRRTIVITPRTRDEKLEHAAKRLVQQLKAWLEESS